MNDPKKDIMQSWEEAARIGSELSLKHRLALYSKAGFIKTKYSDKVYKELAPFLNEQGELNGLGKFTVAALRRGERERIMGDARREASKQLEGLRSITIK